MSIVMISESDNVAFLFRFLVVDEVGRECFLNSCSKRLQKSSTFTNISATLSEKSGVLIIDLLNWLSTIYKAKIIPFFYFIITFLHLFLSRTQVINK